MKITNSAVPIQDNMAPERIIICRLNQLRKPIHVDISVLIIMLKVCLRLKLQIGKKYALIP
jgi:hypothetical protein